MRGETVKVGFLAYIIAEKFEISQDFKLKILYIEMGESATKPEVKSESEKPDILPELSEQELIEKEPIIGYILKKFDGTLMD